MPFLGRNQYDGLDVSPDNTPSPTDILGKPVDVRARHVVERFSLDAADERMLLELLGLTPEPSV